MALLLIVGFVSMISGNVLFITRASVIVAPPTLFPSSSPVLNLIYVSGELRAAAHEHAEAVPEALRSRAAAQSGQAGARRGLLRGMCVS